MDLEELASQWIVRSEAPDFTPSERAELDAWVKSDIRHHVAFLKVTKCWNQADQMTWIKPLQGDPDPDLLDQIDLTVRAVPSTLPPPRRPPKKNRTFLIAAVTAGCVAAAAAGWRITDALQWQHYSTGVGGAEHFPLPDGSIVALNTSTEIAIRYTEAGREFKLLHGEAQIEAARDDRRPFRLNAGDNVFKTAGANFDIRLRTPQKIELLVSAGRVATEPSPGLMRYLTGEQFVASDIVSAGYRATVDAGTIRVAWVEQDEIDRQLTWKSGSITFRGESLREAASEFNRYNTRKIVIADASISDRQVGGAFQATDPESFVAALKLTMGITAVTIGGEEGPGYGVVRLSMASR